MIGRLHGLFFALLLALCGFVLTEAAGASPVVPPPPRIVAVGDLHGDFEAWRGIARAAGLIDDAGRWAGGRAILVQTGDVVDRGPDSLRILRDLMRLQAEAAAAGGQVVALVGNHEAMNVTGDLRYVHPGEYAAFANEESGSRRRRVYRTTQAEIEASYRATDPHMSEDEIRRAWLAAHPLGAVEHRAAWAPDGELGRWIAGNPAVALIGDTLFAHGGIGPAYAGMPLDEINRRAAAALAAHDDREEAIINDPAGPLWYRGLLLREDGASQASIGEEVDAVLRGFGAMRIVVGHTPLLGGVGMRLGGRLIGIDTGIASHYGGVRSYLEIRDGRAIAHVVGEGDNP